jgi:hypothetical protein
MRCMVEIERYVENAFVVVWLEHPYFTNSGLGILGGWYAFETLIG